MSLYGASFTSLSNIVSMKSSKGKRKALTSSDRERMVSLFTQGFSYSFIAREYRVSPSTVWRLVQKFMCTSSTERRPGSGRRRKTTPREDSMILREVRKTRRVAAHRIRKDLELEKVSCQTIRRRIKESGEFKSYWATKKPIISEANRAKRLEWCEAHKDWTIEQWRRVLWSDESPFHLRNGKRFRVWRGAHEQYHPECYKATVKHDKKVMVWGCFAAHGVGDLKRVVGIMDAKMYHGILQWHMKPSVNRLFPDKNCIFQQDNDPKHTAHLVRNYLANYEVPVLPWPSQSPDLNPIENLWSILDDKVKDRRPQNEDQLFEILSNAWQALDPELLTKLADSMPKRIEAVCAARGFPTKY